MRHNRLWMGTFGVLCATAAQAQPGLESRVYTDRTQYGPSRAVEITTLLRNNRTLAHTVNLRGQFEYEIIVRESRSRKIVWTWSKNKQPPRFLSFTIQPGEERFHTELWDRRDDLGNRVVSGVYEIEARQNATLAPVRTMIYLGERDGAPQPPRPTPTKPPMPNPPPSQPTNPQLGPLFGVLRSSTAVLTPGATVSVTYTVHNTGQQAESLRFSSGRQFELELSPLGPGTTPLWCFSTGRSYAMAFTSITLQSKESTNFTTRVNLPATLPAGDYLMTAYLTPVGAAPRSVAVATLPVRVVR